MRVLIVDDDVVQVESLKPLLEHHSYSVITALTTEAASIVADTHPPDAMILDWVLVGGGPTFIAHMRAKARCKDMPVVIVTGMPVEKVDGLEHLTGITVLQKPYEFEDLLAALPKGAK